MGSWIEGNCVIPDGIHQGDPFVLTNEQLRFLVEFYRLRPDAIRDDNRPSRPFAYRGGLLMRAQKWGKGPFAAAICLAEAFGPVRFAGWTPSGEPVGRPQPTPHIQIVATSEEQTDNTWLALYEMASRGPVAHFEGIELGVGHISLPGGGKIEPMSASARARLGARLTFAVFDESHLMVESNGGVKLATTMKRNIAGMGGRWLETTNAYDPSESSAAQRTHQGGAPDVLIDYRVIARQPDFNNDQDCLALLDEVYGDSHWVDRERILADARDPAVCPSPSDALRFFFNLIVVGVSDVIDPTKWDAMARKGELEAGEMVALGFDGSRTNDCTSLVASRIKDGRWFHLQTWDPKDYAGTVPRAEVDSVVRFAFEAYDVKYLFADPPLWQEKLDLWESLYPKRIVGLHTNSAQRMDDLLSRFRGAVSDGLTHDGHPTLTQHIRAAALTTGARRAPRPEEDPSVQPYYMTVVKKKQTGHIDAFIAGLLANRARSQAIEEGALNSDQVFASWR